jgi:hypothetical protein
VRAALVAVLVAVGLAGNASAERTAALLVTARDVSPERIEAARQREAARAVLVADAAKRKTLETFAPSPTDEVARALDRVPAKLSRFDLEGARHDLDAALLLAEELPPSPKARAQFVAIALYAAEVALAAGDEAAQTEALDHALAARADLTLDPARYPPPLRARLAEVRQARARASGPSFRLTSDPPGAAVVLDGEPRGETPLVLASLGAAAHLVSLSRPGFRARTLRLPAARDAALAVTLPPLDDDERLSRLVDAVRAAGAGQRPSAARALAAALSVDAIVVLGPDERREVYERLEAAAPAIAKTERPQRQPERPRPWWRRGWVWGLAGGVVVAGAIAAGVGGYYGSGRHLSVSVACCQ